MYAAPQATPQSQGWRPEVYQGYLIEQAPAGHWLARDPWTGLVMPHHGTSMVCRYPTA